MCTKLSDNIVTFNVSGFPVKITTQKLAEHPDCSLTAMVNNTVQPPGGFFIQSCPKVFGYILRFLIHDIKLNSSVVATKIGSSEKVVRAIVDEFRFKNIYTTDQNQKSEVVVDQKSEIVVNQKSEVTEEPITRTIWELAEEGDLDKLRIVIKRGTPVDKKCSLVGSTALMYAIRNGKLECVDELIRLGADVNIINNNGATPLYIALINGNREIVKMLIARGADVNAVKDGMPLLHRAIMNKQVECSYELLNSNVNINAQDMNGLTPLHHAVITNSLELVKALLQKGADSNIINKYGNTPLLNSLQDQSFDLFKELLPKCANINLKASVSKHTPLHMLSISGQLELVKDVINLGADVNLQNCYGQTPLHCASYHGNVQIVQELLQHKADVTIKNKDNDTALKLALKQKHREVVKELIKVIPLNGNSSIVELLLENVC
jgi:ankyrin repeat protein